MNTQNVAQFGMKSGQSAGIPAACIYFFTVTLKKVKA